MSFRRVSHQRLALGLLALVLSMVPVSSQSPAFYPDDPIGFDDDMSLDASKVVADRRFEWLRLRREHIREAQASGTTIARAERQHHRRGAGLELVRESHRAADALDRRARARPRSVRLDFARRLEGERRQVDRPAAGLPNDRPIGSSLPDRVRSTLESRDGDGCGDYRHGVLSRVRVSHRGRVLAELDPGEDRDRSPRRASPIRWSASDGR